MDFISLRRGNKYIVNNTREVEHKYTRLSFKVTNYHGNNKSRKLKEYILPATMHIWAAGKCTDNVEKSIKKAKQLALCMVHSIPYRNILNLMIARLLMVLVKWINSFPFKTDI